MATPKKDLTHLQNNCLNNLMKGMSQGEAYIKAGYKVKSLKVAEAAASRLLSNVKFRNEYEKAKKKAAYKAGVSQTRILTEEKCLAYSDPGNLFDLQEGKWTLIPPPDLPEEVRRAISGLEIVENYYPKLGKHETKYKYKFWDKGRSLERLGRVEGIYNDKVTVGVDNKLLETIFALLPEEFVVAIKAIIVKKCQAQIT